MKNKAGLKTRNPLFLRHEELERSLFLMLRADLAMSGVLRSVQETAGVSAGLLKVLLLIKVGGSVNTGELRDRLNLPKQTLSNHLQELVERMMVTSMSDPRDQRKLIFSVTEAGDALARKVLDRQKRLISGVYSEVGPDAVEGFNTVLERLAHQSSGGRSRRRP